MGAGASDLAVSETWEPTGSGLGDMPELCAAEVLLRLAAPDICRLVRLNRAFRSAGAADFVWEAKLPENYEYLMGFVDEEEGERSAVGKKEVYARLAKAVQFEREFWLEKSTGMVCMAISTKALVITGIDDKRYWVHIPTAESRVCNKLSLGFEDDHLLLAILAASVTYQAGLKPPGGTWEKSVPNKHITEGNPVLRLSDLARYPAFYYSNSASFAASVVVIVLLLQESLQDRHGLLIYAMNTAIVLDLLGLLGAYAAGSSRAWDTSGYVIALTAAVLAYVTVHLVIWLVTCRRGRRRVSSMPQELLPAALAPPKGTTRCSSIC